MTKEEKQLLLIDLSARLPYYPKCEMIDEIRVVKNEKDSSYISTLFPKHIELFSYHNNFIIKPYLRPMSSMTEEEKKELKELHFYYTDAHIINDEDEDFKPIIVDEMHCSCIIDWLNTHHFDYRGLIERGLALKASEVMYKF